MPDTDHCALPRRRYHGTAAVLVLLLLWGLAAPVKAAPTDDYRHVLDITFPVAGSVWFADDYAAWRSGGRRHQSTDLFAPKGTPVYAALAGTICLITGVTEPVPSYGYMIKVCGDDGREYDYLHLSNDRLGTDDGLGGPAAAYAPGMAHGVRVRRGELIGFIGDSGNAEDTPPHLHFEIEDGDLRDPRLDASPWKQGLINPYPSLIAAQKRGDLPGAGQRLLQLATPYQRGDDVREFQRGLAALGIRDGGAALAVDGVFGPQTDRAARVLQQQAGLDPIGVVGPKTRAALASALAGQRGGGASQAPAAPSAASSVSWPGRYLKLTTPYLRGADVRTFQARLTALGYRNSRGASIIADGVWGPETDRAARAFIADAGLPNIPIVGPRTWAKAFDR